MSTRQVLVVTHTGRPEALVATHDLLQKLDRAGLQAVMLAEEAAVIDGVGGATVVDDFSEVKAAEICVVLGGDGTVLRAADMVRDLSVPLLGVNLGHVGFLAEIEPEDLDDTVHRIAQQRYVVEERMTLDVRVRNGGENIATFWALNEATVEKGSRARMVEVAIEVDGRPVSTFGADGVVMATPTGSTAYAFSAGGPVVWPEVEALLLVPNAAHALFARPLVTSPTSVLAVEVLGRSGTGGVLWCDGRRAVELPPGSRVEACRSQIPVRLARIITGPFTNRLVAKFQLPVSGWRGPARGH